MTFRAHCRSAASLFVITANLCFWLPPLLVLALVKLAVPAARDRSERAMAWIYRVAVIVDDVWLGRVMGLRWSRPELGLDPARSYLVLSNHVSWADILLIQSVIVRQGPLLKFLAKRELIYVPIVGLIIWAFDFPILRRRSRRGADEEKRRARDLQALRQAGRRVQRAPAALMNFAEGTRFSEVKRVQRSSPYRHLLTPRVGGFLTLTEAVEEGVEGLIDLTLVYPKDVSFWGFLAGDLPEIEIRAQRIDSACLPRTRESASRWLAERWSEKDAAIAESREPAIARGASESSEASSEESSRAAVE